MTTPGGTGGGAPPPLPLPPGAPSGYQPPVLPSFAPWDKTYPDVPAGGGNFNPNVKIDTSRASVAPTRSLPQEPYIWDRPDALPGQPNFESGGAVPEISSQRSLLEQLTLGLQTPNRSDIEARLANLGYRVRWEPAGNHSNCRSVQMYGALFCSDHGTAPG